MSSLQRERRVLIVVGTRPEAIKMAPVLRELRSREGIDVRLALTGQHSDLVDEVLSIFSLAPDWDLDIMREGQTPAEVGRGCLLGIERIASRETRPPSSSQLSHPSCTESPVDMSKPVCEAVTCADPFRKRAFAA